MTAVSGVMPNRMDRHPPPTEADLTTTFPDEMLTRYFAWFRSSVRYALWPVAPNNPGWTDNDIIEAVVSAVDELVERRRNSDGGMEAPNPATLRNYLAEWAGAGKEPQG